MIDCIVAMPTQLFLTTGIPVCLWFISRDKTGKNLQGGGRDRRGETLFIDAREMGQMETRSLRVLSGAESNVAIPPPESDVGRIAGTFHAWRGEQGCDAYEDVPGFCKSATLADIEKHGFVLTPGRYVGAAELEDDGEPFDEKMERLVTTLNEQFAASAKLEAAIRSNLKGLGYGG